LDGSYVTWFNTDDFPFFRPIEEMGSKLSCPRANFHESTAGRDMQILEKVVYGGRLVVWTCVVVV
jgi:hypothetical protein